MIVMAEYLKVRGHTIAPGVAGIGRAVEPGEVLRCADLPDAFVEAAESDPWTSRFFESATKREWEEQSGQYLPDPSNPDDVDARRAEAPEPNGGQGRASVHLTTTEPGSHVRAEAATEILAHGAVPASSVAAHKMGEVLTAAEATQQIVDELGPPAGETQPVRRVDPPDVDDVVARQTAAAKESGEAAKPRKRGGAKASAKPSGSGS